MDKSKRQQEIDELCLLYDKRILAQELMLAHDLIALYQEQMFKSNGEFVCRKCGVVDREDICYEYKCPRCGSMLMYNDEEKL